MVIFMNKNPVNRGPKPDHVKIDIDWEKAVKKALKKDLPKVKTKK